MHNFLFYSKTLPDIYFGVFIKEFEKFIVSIDLIPLKWSDNVKTLLIHETPETMQIVEEYKDIVEAHLQKNDHSKFLSKMSFLLLPDVELLLNVSKDHNMLMQILNFNLNPYDHYNLSYFGEKKLPNPADFNLFFSIENEIENLKNGKVPDKSLRINKICTNQVCVEVKENEYGNVKINIEVNDEKLLNITKEELEKLFKEYQPWKYEY